VVSEATSDSVTSIMGSAVAVTTDVATMTSGSGCTEDAVPLQPEIRMINTIK